ncbi:pyridoxamine 5'-phosphate oxidase family protein [Luteipulveratus mongoliensis]|uniref:pyridoxamine 5'-phosphate oxidase family protein n=1 Tax=Luteipulveratus mongoliensis TaxID=571913 RepID=UPI000698374E|nr:pyridoxamine 5'-phosphate oxidase family protein [Luteipulveratus mongoliensis]
MTTPQTELDQRFSEADTSATPWETTRGELDQAQLFWVVTVRADGRPHVSPLVAVLLDDTMYFTTGPTEQKDINLQANPHVILLTGSNDWQSGLDVVVEGEATLVTDPAALTRLAELWAQKWDGTWQYEVVDGEFRQAGRDERSTVYSVPIRKALAFGKGPFTHTRHRFA